MVLAFALTFNYTGNVAGMVMAMVERSFKKWKYQKLLQKDPQTIAYQSALDTQYVPKKLSHESYMILS